jgi:PGF-CTERM protein
LADKRWFGWKVAQKAALASAKTASGAKHAVTKSNPVETPKIAATGTPASTQKAPGFGIVLVLVGLIAVVLTQNGGQLHNYIAEYTRQVFNDRDTLWGAIRMQAGSQSYSVSPLFSMHGK